MKFIVISYDRATTLKNKTLKTLAKHGIELSEIEIWVSNPAQLEIYKSEIPGGRFHVSNTTCWRDKVNTIFKYHESGQPIVMMDDDISDIKTVRPNFNLRAVFEEAFQKMTDLKTTLCTSYPCGNPFFMRDRWRAGMTFCCTMIAMFYNDPEIEITSTFMGDMEWGALVYKKRGNVLRYEGFGPVSKLYSPGGQQSASVLRNVDTEREDKEKLYERHKDLFTGVKLKRNGHYDIKIRRSLSYILASPAQSDDLRDDLPETPGP